MIREVIDQIEEDQITHIILQAGVGGMAGAMIAGIARYLKNIPTTIDRELRDTLDSMKEAQIRSEVLKRKDMKINID